VLWGGGEHRRARRRPRDAVGAPRADVVLHPDERFTPVPVDGFLADSDVKQKQPDGSWAVAPGPLPTSGGTWRLDQRLCNVRDGLMVTDCYATAEAAHGAAPTVYGATFRRGKRIALQYWLFYPFNPYSPEVPPNPDFAQMHEGDWELVTVITDAAGKPLTAGYSRHCAGARREWAKVEKRGSRPVVYVALGSHANYFAPGSFALEKRCWVKEALIVFETYNKALRDFAGAGRPLRPRVVTAKSPTWMLRARGARIRSSTSRRPASPTRPAPKAPRSTRHGGARSASRSPGPRARTAKLPNPADPKIRGT
jgi:hypothetical protein